MTNIDHAAEIIGLATRGAHTTDGHPMKMSDHTAQVIAEALADEGLITPGPKIIRTRDELVALDPDTLVTAELPTREDSPFPHAVAWGASVAYDLDLIWRGPLVVIAAGDHVRAARQALEEA